MRPQAPARVVRQRKLAKTTPQSVLREEQLEAAEYNSLQNQYSVETGVEKSEEKEYHLQAALKASAGSGDKNADQEIPAPRTEHSKGIDYDSLYALVFQQPTSYIKFSQTVEECTGCQYNMTIEDDAFLKAFNQKKSARDKCSEDDFEKTMWVLEETAELQAPYAAVDGTVIPFETMKLAVRQEGNVPMAHVKEIYEHWKARRQDLGNHPLQPSLKVEKNQDKDDGDPYVCFRRRDVRQTRKTRARDTQTAEKLKTLRIQLEQGRRLIEMSLSREFTKQALLNVERQVFEGRLKVKEAKVRLGIKGDDDDLINQRPQKRKTADFLQLQQQRRDGPGAQIRFPGRADGKPLDADFVLLLDQREQRKRDLEHELEEKAQQHRKWNIGHVDLTREPLSPIHGQEAESGFRTAVAQLITPPSSVTSESFDHSSAATEKPEMFSFRYDTPPEEDESRGKPAYRRRMGRGNRLWIDRRGMPSAAKDTDGIASDRWKYDNDDEDEQPVYEMDPYNTKALRFRASIPMPPHLFQQHARQNAQARIAAAGPSQPAQAPT